MAINLIQTPFAVNAAHNQMLFNVSSTNASTKDNFNFIADIYVNSVIVSRLAFPKQPSVNTCMIDVGVVLKNYVKYDFLNIDPATDFYATNLNSRVKYQVKFGELYDVSGIPTIFTNLKTFPASGMNTATNAIFDFQKFNSTDNILNIYNVSSFGFLTDIPETIKIQKGQQLRLSIYDPSNLANLIGIDGTYYTLTETSGEYLYNINFTKYMNDKYGSDWPLGNHYFGVFKNLVFSKSIIIEVVEPSCKYDTYRIHWLNNLGGWDSYNFDKINVQSMDIEKKQYKKILSPNYNISDRLKTNYNTTITDKITINTDWVSDAMATWFQGLFQSPIVFLELSNGKMVAINLENTNYEIMQYENGRKLHNISASFEYSYNRYRQSM